MSTFVLTVVGDDRPGLVEALADVVTDHGGNWERSQLAELAGLFAGIVVVEVPDDRADELRTALDGLEGIVHVGVHAAPGGSPRRPATTPDAGGAAASGAGVRVMTLDLLGNDRPGIVRELSGVFARHGVSIESLRTATREAPMAGGVLFEAHLEAPLPADSDVDALRADLERLASELMVDLTLDA